VILTQADVFYGQENKSRVISLPDVMKRRHARAESKSAGGYILMASIVRYNPFNDIVALRGTVDRLFEDSFIPRTGIIGRGSAANLYETAEGFVVQLPMPGVNPEEVEITVQDDSLNVKWQTSVTVPENATTHWSGFKAGKYQQSFTLPAAINSEKVEASYENGVLILNLPKAEHVKARTVKVTLK
jgi:HSP20 family protein